MTRQVTGVTTLFGSTGLFGTLAKTNNTDIAISSLEVAGGTGDKWILLAGTTSI